LPWLCTHAGLLAPAVPFALHTRCALAFPPATRHHSRAVRGCRVVRLHLPRAEPAGQRESATCSDAQFVREGWSAVERGRVGILHERRWVWRWCGYRISCQRQRMLIGVQRCTPTPDTYTRGYAYSGRSRMVTDIRGRGETGPLLCFALRCLVLPCN
jgi:hypothetical protein